ncbi:MAG: hypothetical protein QXU18_15955 [Thermoplasmatales archaeon]
MTDDSGTQAVKGVGHGVTLHVALEWALTEIASEGKYNESAMPNVWNYSLLGQVYSEFLKHPMTPEEATQQYDDSIRKMDEKYGSKKFHAMTKEERWDRLYATLLYFTYLGAHQLQKEEQQWSDDELAVTEREETNAR